jgi:hypothetical protein
LKKATNGEEPKVKRIEIKAARRSAELSWPASLDCAPAASGIAAIYPKLRWLMCGRSGLARAFFTFGSIGRCSHVSGLLTLVHMLADQVPVKTSHSTMRWH